MAHGDGNDDVELLSERVARRGKPAEKTSHIASKKCLKNGKNQTLGLKYPYGKGRKLRINWRIFLFPISFLATPSDRWFRPQRSNTPRRASVLTSLDSNNMEDEAATATSAPPPSDRSPRTQSPATRLERGTGFIMKSWKADPVSIALSSALCVFSCVARRTDWFVDERR